MTDYNKSKVNNDETSAEYCNPEITRSENLDLELAKMGRNDLRFLNRTELLEILLDYARENEKLKEDIEQMQGQLEDKRIKINKFGSIAQASLELNGVFEAAEASCAQYIENAKIICDRQTQLSTQKLEEAQREAQEIVEKAKSECEDIEAQKAELMRDTLLECERIKSETEQECKSKIEAVDKLCEEKISNAQKQVDDKWSMLSQKLEEFYNSHMGLMELINQGLLPIPGRGKVNET